MSGNVLDCRNLRLNKTCVLTSTWANFAYWLPVSAITNYHKCINFKQDEFIILHFWRSDIWIDIIWLKSRCWQGCIPSEASTAEFFSPAFPTLGGCLHCLDHGFFFCYQNQLCSILSFLSDSSFMVTSSLVLAYLPSSYKNLVITWCSLRKNLLVSRSLI